MRESISFIHCADLHLDSPLKGMKTESDTVFEAMKESTFYALDKLIEQAVLHQVDFILIVGDIFDHNHPSLKAVMRFKKAMEKLEEHGIQVFLSYGNHDFNQSKTDIVSLPENVQRFTDGTVTAKSFLRGGTAVATIYGFSYLQQAVTENKTPEYIKEERDGFHIGMLHGSISTNTEHEPYAPFLISELADKPFDYWALGHIHKREIIRETPPVVYPGNIQGRSRKESGEKGCYLVRMDSANTEMTFLPLQHIRFKSVTIEIEETLNISGLQQLISNRLFQIQEYGCYIIDLAIKSPFPLIKDWQREGYLTDLAELINEQFLEAEEWVYLREIEVVETPDWNIEELREGQHFIGEMIRKMETPEWRDSSLDVLFHHKKARRYMEALTEEEKNRLASEARDEVLRLLLQEGEPR